MLIDLLELEWGRQRLEDEQLVELHLAPSAARHQLSSNRVVAGCSGLSLVLSRPAPVSEDGSAATFLLRSCRLPLELGSAGENETPLHRLNC